MNKPKIGDRIRITFTESCCVKQGQIGTLIDPTSVVIVGTASETDSARDHGGDYWAEIDGHEFNRCCLGPDWFEVIGQSK
jgi:hypothetical protein